MSSLLRAVRRREARRAAPWPTMPYSQFLDSLTYQGLNYPIIQSQPGFKQDEIAGDFRGYVEQAFKANGIVFACIVARMLLFSEARFQWRQFIGGRPGNLFGSPELARLEKPWPGGTTREMLCRALQDVDTAGNFYAVSMPGNRVLRARPDWMTIVMGSKREGKDIQPQWELDAEVIGYVYTPGGPNSGAKSELIMPERVAHWAPTPDPTARFRGMSWLQPVVQEIMGDQAAMAHKLQFFEHGATSNFAVILDKSVTPKQFKEWVELFDDEHEGLPDAYRTLYLGGGADVKTVGADMKQLDFKVTQGHGETRLCAAARIPPIVVGISEGLDAATYSNYGQARRAFADGTLRPLWGSAAGALGRIVPRPRGADNAELWYDDRDIPFLQEDAKDDAAIQQTQAGTIRELVDAGFTPDVVVDAVTAGDLSRLKGQHSGLYSVQLQKPGQGAGDAAASASNGTGAPETVPPPSA